MSFSRLAFAFGLLAAVSCDFSRPADEPNAGLWSIRSQPADGAQDVPLRSRLVVRLDRLVLPRSANPSVVRLSSGAVRVPTSVRFMPVQREIWIDLDRNTPDEPLDPETEYLLEVDGLIDLDRNAPDEPYRARFRTGHEHGVVPAEPNVDAQAALHLLGSSCATAACHAARTPAAGLDLSSYAAIARTAIGAPSQVAAGTTRSEGARGALTLAGLRIIDVVAGRGQPATSLLVYKVLGDAHVAGEPMPPFGEPLTRAQLELLSTWIEAGAPPP